VEEAVKDSYADTSTSPPVKEKKTESVKDTSKLVTVRKTAQSFKNFETREGSSLWKFSAKTLVDLVMEEVVKDSYEDRVENVNTPEIKGVSSLNKNQSDEDDERVEDTKENEENQEAEAELVSNQVGNQDEENVGKEDRQVEESEQAG
jgi:hypothetical protein